MMTSRAEYRLLLRQDNADLRLTEKGHEIGLISDERYSEFRKKQEAINEEIDRVKTKIIKPTDAVNEFLRKHDSSEIKTGVKLADLIKRTELSYDLLSEIDDGRPNLTLQEKNEVEIQVKYEGYINMEKRQVEKFKELESKKIPESIDYNKISGLRIEARQKLSKIRPLSIGQASRISGVSPADISVLLIYLHK